LDEGAAMTALREQELGTLEGAVATPTYDRTRLQAGIIHIGVGGFHRAHQAMYLDELMNAGKAYDWAICGLGLMPGDARMRDALASQDGLYTLAVKHPDGQLEARVIGSIVDYLYAPDDPEAALERMCDPAIRIFSLTVTEADTTSTRSPASSTSTTPPCAPISNPEPPPAPTSAT